jgi:hypothetical protein
MYLFSIAWEGVLAFWTEIFSMSELRERMIADMRSQGLSASTQEVYLQGVKGLAAYDRRSPDQLDEKDMRRYLLYLRDERGVARGTFTPHQGPVHKRMKRMRHCFRCTVITPPSSQANQVWI